MTASNDLSLKIGFETDPAEVQRARAAMSSLAKDAEDAAKSIGAAGDKANAELNQMATTADKSSRKMSGLKGMFGGGKGADGGQAAAQFGAAQSALGTLGSTIGGVGGSALGATSGFAAMLPSLGSMGPLGVAAGIGIGVFAVAIGGLQEKFAEAQAAANAYANTLDEILRAQYGDGTLEDAQKRVSDLNQEIQIQTEKLGILQQKRDEEFATLVQSFSAWGVFADIIARLTELFGGGGRGAYDESIDATEKSLREAQVAQETWNEAITNGRFATEAATQAQEQSVQATVAASAAIVSSAQAVQAAAASASSEASFDTAPRAAFGTTPQRINTGLAITNRRALPQRQNVININVPLEATAIQPAATTNAVRIANALNASTRNLR